MQRVKMIAEENLGFLVRSGDSSFWYDCWDGVSRLADLPGVPASDIRLRDIIQMPDDDERKGPARPERVE